MAELPIGWAIHQMKRDARFRAVVVAPPDHTIVEFDASGQEYRWMAIASGDPVMMKLCAPGEDPHSFMGSRITNADYKALMVLVKAKDKKAADDRQLGKVGNLSLQYRTSAAKLRVVARVQYNIPLDLKRAEAVKAVYLRTYKQVPVYWKSQIGRVKALGYVETMAGRRVQVKGDWGGSMAWSMGSTAINYRIQGTGADQKYLALKYLKPLLIKYRVKFGWDLHDGLYFYVPDRFVKEFAEEAREILDNLPYEDEWGFEPPIPLPWDCKYGKSWGALKEMKFA